MMQHRTMQELESIRNMVVASFRESEGSIMYMGSEGNKHYFKSSISRRTVVITSNL